MPLSVVTHDAVHLISVHTTSSGFVHFLKPPGDSGLKFNLSSILHCYEMTVN